MGKTTPVFAIAKYLFRNDDGDESSSGATSIGSADTAQNIDIDTTKRIRLLVRETAGGAVNNVSFTWEYNHVEGTNTWTSITTTSSVVKAVTSQLVDDADTTDYLNAGTYTFITDNNGQCEDGVTTSAACDYGGNDATEVELSFQIISTDISAGDTIQFRVLIDTTAPTLSVTPTAYAAAGVAFSVTGSAGTGAVGTVTISGVGDTVLVTGVEATAGTAGSGGGSTTDTYYFDAHTSLVDTLGVWSNDSNAFDNDIGVLSFAECSDLNSKLTGVGTTAPTTGGTITLVEWELEYFNTLGIEESAAYNVKYSGQNIGNFTDYIGGIAQGSSGWSTLSVPTGGWDWTKVSELSVEAIAATGA